MGQDGMAEGTFVVKDGYGSRFGSQEESIPAEEHSVVEALDELSQVRRAAFIIHEIATRAGRVDKQGPLVKVPVPFEDHFGDLLVVPIGEIPIGEIWVGHPLKWHLEADGQQGIPE